MEFAGCYRAQQQHLFKPGARLRQQSGVEAWSLYYSSRKWGSVRGSD